MKKFVIFGAMYFGISMPANAQTFSINQLPQIIDTSKSNEMRFNRDYKNKVFSAALPVHNIQENPFISGNYIVTFGSGIGFGGGIDCKVSDKPTIDMMSEWNKGDLIQVSGTINSTVMGDLQLTNCLYSRK